MKKVLVLMLVLGLATAASAAVIDVVAVDVGQSGGRTGGPNDPLEESDVIGLAIVLTHNPYPDFPTYDGYWTDGIDVDLHVSGPGSLDVPGLFDKNLDRIGDDLQKHADWGVWAQSGNNDGTPAGYEPLIVGNAIGKMSGGVLENGITAVEGGTDLIWNLLLHCDGPGEVIIDLTFTDGRYADASTPGGNYYGDLLPLSEALLGDLVIYQAIPEPMTIGLLGLGGLFLRRRK